MPENSMLIVAMVAIGMAISFFAADPKSGTSRAIAWTLGMLLGLGVGVRGVRAGAAALPQARLTALVRSASPP